MPRVPVVRWPLHLEVRPVLLVEFIHCIFFLSRFAGAQELVVDDTAPLRAASDRLVPPCLAKKRGVVIGQPKPESRDMFEYDDISIVTCFC